MSPITTAVSSPRSLAEALEALAGATEATRVLAGGTDLMVEFRTGRTQPDRVVDVWRVDELRGIRAEGGGLRIGALATCLDLRASALAREHADVLVAAAEEVGAEQIQARATIGGNLATASPAADLMPVLFALDAEVRLVSRAGARSLPVAELLTGYRTTAKRPDELIESVLVPPRPPGERRGFRKVGTRRAQSISKVVVALAVTLEDGVVGAIRASAGSVADRTILLPSLARELAGTVPDRAAIERAARRAASEDCSPVDDVRSTARYRREVLRRILRTLLAELLLEAG